MIRGASKICSKGMAALIPRSVTVNRYVVRYERYISEMIKEGIYVLCT